MKIFGCFVELYYNLYQKGDDRMNVDFAFFCDAATVDASGKLSVLGVFRNIRAREFPCAHPQMSFVAVMEAHRSEIGIHNFKINFVDEDGKSIIQPLEGNFEVSPDFLGGQFILNLNNIQFPRPGTYAADITIDNQHKKSVSLMLIKS